MNDFFNEHGGNHFAKQLIVAWLNEMGFSNIKLISSVTGLPEGLALKLLSELEKEGAVKRGKLKGGNYGGAVQT